MPVKIDMDVDINVTKATLKEVEKQIRLQMDKGMDALLVEIEDIQITSYTGDAKPTKPPGSTYIRTFELKESSRTEITNRTKRTIEGRWYTDLDYAKFVLGTVGEQDNIHRGRWKSTEEVEEILTRDAPAIIKGVIDDLQIP